jgi:hypothetical protein
MINAWTAYKAHMEAKGGTPDLWVASLTPRQQSAFLRDLTLLMTSDVHMTRDEFDSLGEHRVLLEDMWEALNAEWNRQLRERIRRQRLRHEAQQGLSFVDGERGALTLSTSGEVSLAEDGQS